MKIYMMRHGETDLNKKRCFYGSQDVSINQKGVEQALLLHDAMADISIARVYTSSLKRTIETAKLIFEDHNLIELCSSLDEKDFGQWEGLDANAIQKQFPKQWQEWLDQPFDVTPPGAESFSHFKERVSLAVKSYFGQYHHNDTAIAIVGHLGVLRLIFQILVAPDANFWDIDFPQGEVILLEGNASSNPIFRWIE